MAEPQAQPQTESLPVTVDTLATAVVVVYTDAETGLVIRSAQIVRDAITAGPQSLEWAMLYSNLRAEADRTAANVARQVRSMAYTVADTAARNGNLTAAAEIRGFAAQYRLPGNTLDLLPHDVNSSRLMAEDLATRLGAAAHRITRFADDAYRAATVSASLEQILTHLGKATPAEAQAQAWRELTAKGITGFTDKAGRQWNLASYVEMAVRTATQRAYNASHRDRLTKAGITYFTISSTGRPCPECAPWEGKVLADAGTGEFTEPNAGEGDPVTVHVAATIEEATAAGLFHPNCKHTLTAFLPGVTVLKPNQWTALDEQRYQDTQKLRAMERAVRAAKLQQAAALNPIDKAAAGRKARQGQAAIRAFTAQTGLLRRPRREQIDLGNKP